MKRRAKILILIGAFSSVAHARVTGNEPSLAALAPAAVGDASAAAWGLADQVSGMLGLRTRMTDQMAPQPDADCADLQAVARRLAALEAQDLFVRTTINGLIEAAPSLALKATTSEALSPILIRHREDLDAALMQLMGLPLVRETGTLAADVVRLADQAARP